MTPIVQSWGGASFPTVRMADTGLVTGHAGHMGKEYGPWVRHDWCVRCERETEQLRWLRRVLGEPTERAEHRVRCRECANEVTRVAG